MNKHLFKFSLLQNINDFMKDLPDDMKDFSTYDRWFEFFLTYLGYSVEDKPDVSS